MNLVALSLAENQFEETHLPYYNDHGSAITYHYHSALMHDGCEATH
jgi:hypothetical protein